MQGPDFAPGVPNSQRHENAPLITSNSKHCPLPILLAATTFFGASSTVLVGSAITLAKNGTAIIAENIGIGSPAMITAGVLVAVTSVVLIADLVINSDCCAKTQIRKDKRPQHVGDPESPVTHTPQQSPMPEKAARKFQIT
jgi:hypothetical protein